MRSSVISCRYATCCGTAVEKRPFAAVITINVGIMAGLRNTKKKYLHMNTAFLMKLKILENEEMAVAYWFSQLI